MKTLKILFTVLALSMVTACTDFVPPREQPDHSREQDLLKRKLTGEWVVSGEKDSYIYAFTDGDTIYTKTREGDMIDLWTYQTITGDSIRIVRSYWTTDNRVIFYSNDSIRIEDFIPSDAAVYPPIFGDAVLIRFTATPPAETPPAISGTWEVKMISISGELTNIDSPINGHEGGCCSDILIDIPDDTQGTIEGHTFYNTIWIGFEIEEHQRINITSYGGTRIAEDECGMAFRDHIMSSVVKFEISNSELTFLDSQNHPVIIFIKKN
jgi:hypothetical protein